jgi:hypothetical protein
VNITEFHGKVEILMRTRLPPDQRVNSPATIDPNSYPGRLETLQHSLHIVLFHH